MSFRLWGFGEIPQSENIKTPKTAPSDKRVSSRTKQLNFKAKEEFYWQLKNRAVEERCMMVEVLERAFEGHVKEKSHHQTGIKKIKTSQPQLKQFWKVNFTCDKCYQRFEKGIVFSLAPNLDELGNYPHYYSNCKETIETPETCSFRERNEQTN